MKSTCLICRKRINEIGYCKNCGLLNYNIPEEDKENIYNNNLKVCPPAFFVVASMQALIHMVDNFPIIEDDKILSYNEFLFCFSFYIYMVFSFIKMKTDRSQIIEEEMKCLYLEEAANYLKEKYKNSVDPMSIVGNLANDLDPMLVSLTHLFEKERSDINLAIELARLVYGKEDLGEGLRLSFFCWPRLAGSSNTYNGFYLAESSDFIFKGHDK